MALEVGRLVVRLDIEGTFEDQILKARKGFEDAAKAAEDLDKRVSNLGKTKVDFPDAPKKKMDDAAASASKLDDNVKKASASGKNLDVSDAPKRKLDDAAASASKASSSMDKASTSGKNMKVSDQPKAKLAETASVADQVNSKLAGLGVTMKQVTGITGAAGMGAVLMKGWDRISSIDTAQGKLRGLGHDAQGVATIMDSALDSVTGTAYGLGDAATIAANAVAAGIKPGKDLTKYLTMTADASAIAGVSLGEMGRILNQVQTGQSAYAGDLSQLADRGIPIYQWLADEAGVAASEIKKMASTGQVSSEMLFAAIQNNIGGAAQEMGGTLVGSLANVGAAFGRLGAAAIDPFTDDIMSAAEGAQKFAGTMASVVGPAASVAATALGGVADVVGMIPTPILAATAGLVALQKTGLGPKMAGAATTTVGALRGVGESIALSGMYAKDGVKANGLFAASMDGIKGAAGSMKAGLKGALDMLGGPWMIAAAGAAMVVADFMSAAKSASDTQAKLRDITSAHASAQNELADALVRSNGLLDEQAKSAAADIIQKSIDAIEASASQTNDFMNELALGIQNSSHSYEDYAAKLKAANNEDERGLYSRQLARLEFQALGDAAAEASVEVDDIANIAREGGPKWDQLKQALLNTGGAGAAVVEELEKSKASVDAIVASATEAEVASMALAEAFRVMADESATAEDKANALKQALNALAGDTMTSDEALFAYYGTLDKVGEASQKLAEGTGAFAREIEGGGLAFEHTSERSAKLRDALLEMRDATADAAGAGVDMGPIWERNRSEMEKLAAQTPYTAEQLWELADAALGFSEMDIQATVGIRNGGEVLGQLGNISNALRDVEEGATVEVKNVGDDALQYLRELGWQVIRVNENDIRIKASTAEANAGLQATLQMAANLANADPNVDISTNADAVSVLLDIARDKVNELPDGNVEIDHDIPGLMELLQQLGIKTAEPKNGKLTIDSADVDRARRHAETLNNLQTSHQHTVRVTTINTAIASVAGGPAAAAAVAARAAYGGADGGIQESYADGGVGGLRPWMDGATASDASGNLPTAAKIQRPVGKRGLVQWAEAETEGEAFIPLAASKRQRSRKIWAQTGKLLGIDVGDIAKFANGGFTATKALTGTPYIWGGFSPAGVDCSGLMSVAANEATGRAPYSERTSTHTMGSFLAARGFKRGMGGAGDLRIGWNNGHTAGTAPDGTKFESQTYGRGAVWGGNSRGHDLADFNQHMHLPMAAAASDGLAGDNGERWVDTRTQRQKNIDAIVSEGQRRGLSDRDIQVALMTAEQESGIRVLANPSDPASMSMPNEGVGYDHDSTGIFQQRNNGAWGTLEDRMDPTKSAGMFYDELEKIQGRDQMALTQVAQKVQRSAYPGAYAKHEGKASQELAASKARLEQIASSSGGSGSGGGDGQRVFVTNWPSGGGSYTRSGGSDAIDDAKDAVEDAQKAAFIQGQSIAAMVARAAGRSDLIQVEKFANGGFHGLENHTAHIAPAGSMRIFGEPETGGEAYIPLASHKRARSTAILAETARRMGYTLGAGVNLAGSVLTGNGLDTGWGGPSLSDLGIDGGAMKTAYATRVEQAMVQLIEAHTDLMDDIDRNVDGTLKQAAGDKPALRQQYARAMI